MITGSPIPFPTMRRFLAALALALLLTPLGSAQHTHALPRSTPEQQGVSSSAILDFVESADQTVDTLNSFILVRHGKIIAEGWWAPYDAQTPHVLYSLSKSFTSTAVGLAIAEGKLSLDDEVLKAFPEDAPADPSANLKAMRVRDLLRMSAGNDSEAPLWPDDNSFPKERLTKIFLAHPVPFKPGTRFLYNSPATYMLSAMVQKVTGQNVNDFLRPRLFEPLGIRDPLWLQSAQGTSFGAFGLSLRTEDIAHFGQMYLQKGMWNGKQLIPAAWVEEATKVQTSNGSSPNSDWDQGYGYQFWRSRHNTYRGDGAFGQFCMVLPEQDAVVAITSGTAEMQSVMKLVWDKLLPAIQAKALPEDPTGRRKLHDRLAGLNIHMPQGERTSPAAAKVSGSWFQFPDNDRGIQAISLDFDSRSPVLSVRTAGGESRMPIGIGSWQKSESAFSNGIDKLLDGVSPHPPVAASGAWTASDTFTIKLVAYETPYYSLLKLKFHGDKLIFDSEYNVSFNQRKLPQLIGTQK